MQIIVCEAKRTKKNLFMYGTLRRANDLALYDYDESS